MNRLDAIGSLIDKHSVVADIGCDHAYLLIDLIKNNTITKGYGVDNKKGPLENAKRNISKYNVEGIDLILADGLSFDVPKEVDTIVLAGMGGMLISRILNDGKDKLSNIKTVVVDAHRDIDEVKSTLTRLGYKEKNTVDVIERNKNYHIFRFDKEN